MRLDQNLFLDIISGTLSSHPFCTTHNYIGFGSDIGAARAAAQQSNQRRFSGTPGENPVPAGLRALNLQICRTRQHHAPVPTCVVPFLYYVSPTCTLSPACCVELGPYAYAKASTPSWRRAQRTWFSGRSPRPSPRQDGFRRRSEALQ